MPLLSLTKELLEEKLLATDESNELLTDSDVDMLAARVKHAVGKLYFGEEQDRVLYIKIIKYVDYELYKLLPHEYYVSTKNENYGLTNYLASELMHKISPFILNEINVPILNEYQKEKVVLVILDIITQALVMGTNLKKVCNFHQQW